MNITENVWIVGPKFALTSSERFESFLNRLHIILYLRIVVTTGPEFFWTWPESMEYRFQVKGYFQHLRHHFHWLWKIDKIIHLLEYKNHRYLFLSITMINSWQQFLNSILNLDFRQEENPISKSSHSKIVKQFNNLTRSTFFVKYSGSLLRTICGLINDH